MNGITFTVDTLIQLVGYALMAGAIYGAIKADLKVLHEKVAGASKAADLANQRLDGLLMDHNKRHGGQP